VGCDRRHCEYVVTLGLRVKTRQPEAYSSFMMDNVFKMDGTLWDRGICLVTKPKSVLVVVVNGSIGIANTSNVTPTDFLWGGWDAGIKLWTQELAAECVDRHFDIVYHVSLYKTILGPTMRPQQLAIILGKDLTGWFGPRKNQSSVTVVVRQAGEEMEEPAGKGGGDGEEEGDMREVEVDGTKGDNEESERSEEEEEEEEEEEVDLQEREDEARVAGFGETYSQPSNAHRTHTHRERMRPKKLDPEKFDNAR
jgi:hypothetical protein